MKFFALISTALFTLASAAPAAEPEASTALESTSVEERQVATGFCEFRSPNILYMSYNIEINNTQDGGLCGGFWDNINGSSGCMNATGRECVVEGNIKKIFFRVHPACSKLDIEWIIREVTDPKVEGVVCVQK